MKRTVLVFLTLLLRPWGDPAIGYPLDASKQTGIARLEAYELAKTALLERGTLKPGSLLTSDQIRLRLAGTGFSMPEPDPEFTAKIREMVGPDAPYYGISVLDITDPEHPRLAEINPGRSQNPGSVGKLMVALAWFQTLADIYPDDVGARKRILFGTQITANDFIMRDSHKVPVYKPGDPKVLWRPIEIGDRANLWTWFDWMCSASSNAAGSQLISELVLLKKFGRDYPVATDVAAAFFAKTPQKELTKILLDALETPLTRNGLDVGRLRQGSFFTQEGKRRIPGTTSLATSHSLLRYLTLMEQGKLVDPFSSLEIKKLIYLTDGRIRYAASPALDDAAVYFKSGSLYSCKPEPGYQCGKYMGNKWNYLNSATIVETYQPGQQLDYIVVVLSNVLKKNSAEQHENLAAKIHDLMKQLHPPSGEPSL
jgi:hypothetical protein